MKNDNCNCTNDCFCKIDSTRQIIENMGRIHNLALDRIAELTSFPKETKEEAYLVVAQTWSYELRNLGMASRMPALDLLNDISKKTKLNDKDLLGFFDSLFYDGQLNYTEKDNIGYVLEQTKLIQDSAELSRVLISFENSIYASKILKPTEKMIIGISSVIARSSDEYWRKQLNDEKSPWRKVLEENGIDGGSVFRINWKDLLGGVAGCLACLGSGVVGCIPCAGGGSAFVSNAFKDK